MAHIAINKLYNLFELFQQLHSGRAGLHSKNGKKMNKAEQLCNRWHSHKQVAGL